MEEKQLNIKIPTELDKKLEFFCLEKDQKKKVVVEKALLKYLKVNGNG